MKHEAVHDFYQKGKVFLTFPFLLSKWPKCYAAPTLSLIKSNFIVLPKIKFGYGANL